MGWVTGHGPCLLATGRGSQLRLNFAGGDVLGDQPSTPLRLNWLGFSER